GDAGFGGAGIGDMAPVDAATREHAAALLRRRGAVAAASPYVGAAAGAALETELRNLHARIVQAGAPRALVPVHALEYRADVECIALDATRELRLRHRAGQPQVGIEVALDAPAGRDQESQRAQVAQLRLQRTRQRRGRWQAPAIGLPREARGEAGGDH